MAKWKVPVTRIAYSTTIITVEAEEAWAAEEIAAEQAARAVFPPAERFEYEPGTALDEHDTPACDKNAWFDVYVYATKEDWDKLCATEEIEGFHNKEFAIDEAKLWPEAYQVVVQARGDDNEYEPGTNVFELNVVPAPEYGP